MQIESIEIRRVSNPRRLSRGLPRENTSRSFQVLMAGLDRLAAPLRHSQGDT